MPDYTSILRRSISALPDASPAMREAVYHRARAALARQLTAVDPPLSSRDIEAQHQQLEHSVSLIEAEFAPEAADEPAAPVHYPEPSSDAYRNERGTQRTSTGERGGFSAGLDRDIEDADEFEHDDGYDDYPERSRAPLYTILVVLAVVLIGGAALLYAKRDWVSNLAGLSSQPAASTQSAATMVSANTPAAAPSTPAPAGGSLQKRSDRLTNGDVAQEPDNAAPPAAAADLPGTNADADQVPADADETDAPAVAEVPAAPVPVSPGVAASEAASPGAPSPAAAIVAQRVIFYEQGSAGSPGQAFQGTVTWSQVTRPDASEGIQAVLELPDQNVTVTLSISKNSDESLPASHLVEIQFSGTGKLGASAIEKVPALVLKPNEQARGQPLSGAAVPVMTNLFWIALSSEDEQVSRNLALLRDGSWFDLPILFAGGKRALLTFEKGIPGDKVFETVLASWGGT